MSLRSGPSSRLKAEENPFAILIMAHLKSKATRNRASRRYRWKRQLFQRLLESDCGRSDVEALLDYVDWLMQLPEPFELQLDEEIEMMEATKERVPYKTPWQRRGEKRGERRGLEAGRRQGKAEILKLQLRQRFGELSPDVAERIDRADIDTLDHWSLRFVEAESLDDVFVDSSDS